ncbi:MAG: hypothetical protein ISR58_14885 [Anaerolineales bacterium]|nr:hypothetical protein [Chloroflexota bacterium]MBL6982462.1 hypothetical protein [Anaerolineales bacterium]
MKKIFLLVLTMMLVAGSFQVAVGMSLRPADSVHFLDEFTEELAPEWTWVNEDSERWSITSDGWLEIQASDPGFFNPEGEDTSMVNLLVQPAPEGDLVITTHLNANPDENFQLAGIFLIHDNNNYVSALSAFCLPCLPDAEGFGYFVEAFKGGEYVASGMIEPREADLANYYLRLVYSADAATVTGFYATELDDWHKIGVIEDFPEITQIGLGAANVPHPDGIEEDLVASFDYLEISSETGLPVSYSVSDPPEPTPLPEGVLFRDDFDGYFQPGWSWINENPEKWDIVKFEDETWFQIIADKPGGLAVQSNTLMRPLPDGDFVITAHVVANPRQNFHQANIFIFEDETNFIRLNLGFCDLCGLPTGHGYFMETIIDNNPFGDVYAVPRGAEDTDVYLRLVNENDMIIGYYATELGEWNRIGRFGNFFDFKSVGLGATNSVPEEWDVEDIEALFDYFEITIP